MRIGLQRGEAYPIGIDIRRERSVGDSFWCFLMGILIGVPTGMFSGVLLVWALGGVH